MAKTATLIDNFNDNSTDTGLWYPFGSYSETGGQVVFSYTAGPASYAGYESVSTYDLTGSYVFSQLVSAGNQSLATWQDLPTQVVLDANNALNWYVNTGYIHAQKTVAGVNTDVRADVAYNSAVHKFFRIRELSGTIYWDYSTNGIAWTNYTTLANPFAITAIKLRIAGGCYGAEGSNTSCTIDNFNVSQFNSYPMMHHIQSTGGII